MGISTSNKYRRPSALGPLPPPPWAPVNHSPVPLRGRSLPWPPHSPLSPRGGQRHASRLTVTAEGTCAVRGQTTSGCKLSSLKSKRGEPLKSPDVPSGERRLRSGSLSHRLFRAGERADGLSPQLGSSVPTGLCC